jgi:hypothetical protein
VGLDHVPLLEFIPNFEALNTANVEAHDHSHNQKGDKHKK